LQVTVNKLHEEINQKTHELTNLRQRPVTKELWSRESGQAPGRTDSLSNDLMLRIATLEEQLGKARMLADEQT
jgi:hypothetical protein